MVGQGAGEDEGVGAGGRAERGGDDDVAHQAEAAAQDVAEGDDRRGADQTRRRVPGVATLVGGWRYWRGLHVAARCGWRFRRRRGCAAPSTARWRC